MRVDKSLDDILGEMSFEGQEGPGSSARAAITIWVSPQTKERWDRLQKRTGRQFGVKARELLLAAIEKTEARAS